MKFVISKIIYHLMIFFSFIIIPCFQKSFLKEKIQFKSTENYIFKSIVKIISSPSIPLFDESLYRDIESSGFFISEELILANKKSVPKTSLINVTLFDNTTLKAGLTYEDPFLPFCLLKVNSTDKSYKKRINSLSLKKTLNVNYSNLYEIYIQNNTFKKIPIKVTNLENNTPIRYGNMIKIHNFSSKFLGSPIVNNQNEVIAVNSLICQNSNESYALDVNHVVKIIHDKFLNTFIGDLGVELQKISLNTATNKFNLNSKDYSNSKKFILVSNSPPSLSKDKLFYGDIILKLGNQTVYDNITLIDTILNLQGEKFIDTVISRNGRLLNVSVKINNARKYFSDKYYLISNNIYIQEVSPLLKFKLSNLLPNPQGIIFNIPTYSNSKTNDFRRILIRKINNREIEVFENLLNILKESCNLNSIILEGYDLVNKNLFLNSMKLNTPKLIIKSYKYNYELTNWAQFEEFNFSMLCSNFKVSEKTINAINISQQMINSTKPIFNINNSPNNTPPKLFSNSTNPNRTSFNGSLNLKTDTITNNKTNKFVNLTDNNNYIPSNKKKNKSKINETDVINYEKLQKLFDRIESLEEKFDRITFS